MLLAASGGHFTNATGFCLRFRFFRHSPSLAGFRRLRHNTALYPFFDAHQPAARLQLDPVMGRPIPRLLK
jgi:hypothetical protein